MTTEEKPRHHPHWRARLLAWSDAWDKRIGKPTPSLCEVWKAERAPKAADGAQAQPESQTLDLFE